MDLPQSFVESLKTLGLKSKAVIGTAASGRLAEAFEVELECVLDAPEGEIPVDIPEGAVRSIRAGQDVVYEDLPANANCVMTETRSGGANAVAMAYNGLPVIGSTFRLTSGDSRLALTNIFMLPITGFDVLAWLMAGGGLLTGGMLLIVSRKARRGRVRAGGALH